MEEGGGKNSVFEIVVGTYENFLLGFSLSSQADNDGEQKLSLTPSFTNNSHCGSIRSICSVHKYIASGSTDEVIRLLNLSSRTEHGTLQHHNGTITCLSAYHSYLFSGSDDGTICIWKTGSWQCEKTLHAHPEGVLGISIHPSGKMALSIGKDRSLKTWNLIKGRSGYTTNLKGIADAVQWSTDGNFYAVSIANRLDVYSLESAKIVYTIPFGKKLWHIEFLTDNIVCVGGDTEIVEVHGVLLGKKLTTFVAHKNRVKDMKYHHQQKILVTTSNSDGFIKLWKFPLDNFSAEPKLLVELNTTCRVTCLTIWDKSLVPVKKKTGEEEDITVSHLILQEDEGDDEDEINPAKNSDEEDEMEVEEVQPQKQKKSKKSKKSLSQNPDTSAELTEMDFRQHRKPKRMKRK